VRTVVNAGEPGRWSGRARNDNAAPKGNVTPRVCQAPRCGQALPPDRRRFCSDLCRRRGQRAERITETGDFGQAAIRLIRAMARRVGASDLAEFALMWEIMREAEHAITTAIDELRAKGFTWVEIAAEIGVTRQTMHQWHGRRAGRSAVNTRLTANGALDGSGDTPAQREARRRRRDGDAP
jgi:hypothetical protein